ncbi:Diadenosine tetraphosphate (Ap4A) hydrolase [Algoriphagus hitonicola]|uniref:Diadenosine tetraphosphate (Ap4A) hydrolase n=2 Tax=Algoriphagus hitonicola TaxID=435880 RepID=A0A1I2W1H1_9BACT|nr:Diadenosine tetraphosphate (Ap4A) hydrolase [Algoriphagus hitonicola]
MGLLQGEILDFGCGFGKDVEILFQQGFSIEGYDKYYLPEYPKKRYDTIICFYVLNVLMPEEQSLVLMEISALLKPSGKAYFAVRRDLVYEGFRTHKIHQKPTYQTNVILPFQSIFKNDFCEIYEYRHFNQFENSESSCPFCCPSSETELILESAQAFSIFDKYPVNPGHALIIPKRHVSDYFELSFMEQSSCIFMLNEVKKEIQKRYVPEGFNVGINIGEKAGQTISHVHIHLIPRYLGDVEDPRGGVRGVIPQKRNY